MTPGSYVCIHVRLSIGAGEEVGRLQQSLLAAQHDNTCLRRAADEHSALVSGLRDQLADKAERVLQLEECLLDHERQLAALNHRTKVSCTLLPIPVPDFPHTPPHPCMQSLQCKHSELVVCLGEVEAEREALSLTLQQSQEECSATAKKADERAREVAQLSQQLKAKEVRTACKFISQHTPMAPIEGEAT